MTTYVLVPGAWLGGWCWDRVVAVFREQGHVVYPLTLTGLGERSHLAGPEIGLDTHVQDVVNVLEWEDLSEVVLVGHSYAGFVISGVAELVPGRIGHLVYLDAGVPSDGEALFDSFGEEGRAMIEDMAAAAGEPWRWPLPEDLSMISSLRDISEEDLRWMRARSVAHPLKTFSDRIQINNSDAAAILRTYIFCSAERTQALAEAKHARNDAGWGYLEIETGHWPMITTPQDLADMLLSVRT